MLASALLLISTTIRLSAFSRRREIGIMRLVGASNFSFNFRLCLRRDCCKFGGTAECRAVLASVRFLVQDFLAVRLPFTAFVGLDQALLVVPWLVVGGVILSALASAVAIRRYLKV